MAAFNVDVAHEREISGSTLTVRGYADRMEIAAHVISDPSVQAHSLVKWKDWDAGVVAQVSRPFTARVGEGRWTAGGQVDSMRVDDSVLWTGAGGRWDTIGPSGGLLDLGHERVGSGFVRVTYPWSDRVTASGGLRYDRKSRHEGDPVDVVSPHITLTYVPQPDSSVMFSYSEGFVDAPYWYRYNSLPSYRGSRDLKPEYLKSIQVTPRSKLTDNVSATVNVFFNTLDNLVWRNKNAGPGEPVYQNAGFLKTWGFEPELTYTRPGVTFAANLAFQRVRDAENYDVSGSEIDNVPAWSWNAIATFSPAALSQQDVRLNLMVRYIGEQRSPVSITIGNTTFIEPDRRIDAVTLLNAGISAGALWSTSWFASLRVFNLLDYNHEQGGSVAHPYPQPGRSVLFEVGRRF
jgi:iron complex outermembrane receptor protein